MVLDWIFLEKSQGKKSKVEKKYQEYRLQMELK